MALAGAGEGVITGGGGTSGLLLARDTTRVASGDALGWINGFPQALQTVVPSEFSVWQFGHMIVLIMNLQ
jgi:hypothetical protein